MDYKSPQISRILTDLGHRDGNHGGLCPLDCSPSASVLETLFLCYRPIPTSSAAPGDFCEAFLCFAFISLGALAALNSCLAAIYHRETRRVAIAPRFCAEPPVTKAECFGCVLCANPGKGPPGLNGGNVLQNGGILLLCGAWQKGKL